MCGRHVGLLRDGFCVFAVIITIAYCSSAQVVAILCFSFLTTFHPLSLLHFPLLHFQRPPPFSSAHLLHQLFASTLIASRSFSFAASAVWSKLTVNTKSATSPDSFKSCVNSTLPTTPGRFSAIVARVIHINYVTIALYEMCKIILD